MGDIIARGMASKAITQLAENAKVFNVKNSAYGAVGDNVTDDTAAINLAIVAAIAARDNGYLTTLHFPKSKGYRIVSGISVPKNISIVMDAPIYYDGVANETALTAGSTGSPSSQVKYDLQVIKTVQSNWSSNSCVGIKLINTNFSDINIIQIKNFTVGSLISGDGYGFQDNTTRLGIIYNNRYGITFETDIAVGWGNDNLFQGGYFGVASNINTTISRYGVWINGSCNNNVFIKPDFELSKQASAEAVPVLIDKGSSNSFVSARHEGNSDTFMRTSGDSENNRFTLGYTSIAATSETLEQLGNYPTSQKTTMVEYITNEKFNLVYSLKDLANKATQYLAGDNWHVAGLHGHYNTESFPRAYTQLLRYSKDYLEINSSAACGFFVNTQQAKRFILKMDYDASGAGNPLIRCFDADGNVLTSAGGNHPYVKGQTGYSWAYSSSFGGRYAPGLSRPSIYFWVHQDVKSIEVMFTGSPLKLKSFEFYTLDNYSVNVWLPYEKMIEGACLATTIPATVGTYEKGKMVYNHDPASTEYIGWVCITSGTLTVINTTCTADNSAIVVVASSTGIRPGQYIIIAGGSVRRVVAINGTSVTMDSTVTAGSNLTFVNSPAVLKGFGTIA